jgi:hypothetical protein
MLFGDGEAFVKNSELRRGLASLAADFRLRPGTAIEGLYSYYNVVQRGFPGWFTYGRANARSAFIELPLDAPDPSRQGFGQESAGLDLTSNIAQVRVRHQINSAWRLTAGVLNQRADRSISTQVNALTSSAGAYTSSLRSDLRRSSPSDGIPEGLYPDGPDQTRRLGRDRRLQIQLVPISRTRRRCAARFRQRGVSGVSVPRQAYLPRQLLPLQQRSSAGRQRVGSGDDRSPLVCQDCAQPGLDLGRHLQQRRCPDERLPDERRQPISQPHLQACAAHDFVRHLLEQPAAATSRRARP